MCVAEDWRLRDQFVGDQETTHRTSSPLLLSGWELVGVHGLKMDSHDTAAINHTIATPESAACSGGPGRARAEQSEDWESVLTSLRQTHLRLH